MANQLIAALLAMGITALLMPPLMRWAGVMGVLDRPGGRRIHSKPTPRVGGMAMGVGIMVAMLIWGMGTPMLHWLSVALLVLLAFGIQDDRIELSPRWKLLGQIIAALIVMNGCDVQIAALRSVDWIELPVWISLPLTLMFIVGVTNAINLADGLDGLAGGMTLVCVVGVLLLALTGNSMNVVFLALVVTGATLGFLRFNTHPARVFMGDAGSQLLGFLTAVMALMLTQDRTLPFSPALALLLLGMPVIDTLTVMTERILDGKSPFQADRSHVHHRLLELGFDHYESVVVMYGLQCVFLVLSWQLRYTPDWQIVSIFFLMAAAIVVGLRKARKLKWRWRPHRDEHRSWLTSRLQWLRHDNRLNGWLGYVAGICVAGWALLLCMNDVSVSSDIRLLAILSALILLISLLLRRTHSQTAWLERGALYVAVLIAVLFDHQAQLDSPRWLLVEGVIFGVLFLVLIGKLYLSNNRRFTVTPLDMLVITVAIVLPNMPGSMLSGFAAGPDVLKALLLFYAIESLSLDAPRQWQVFSISALLLLGVVVTAPLT